MKFVLIKPFAEKKPEWNIDGDNKNITPRYLYKNVYEFSIQIHEFFKEITKRCLPFDSLMKLKKETCIVFKRREGSI